MPQNRRTSRYTSLLQYYSQAYAEQAHLEASARHIYGVSLNSRYFYERTPNKLVDFAKVDGYKCKSALSEWTFHDQKTIPIVDLSTKQLKLIIKYYKKGWGMYQQRNKIISIERELRNRHG